MMMKIILCVSVLPVLLIMYFVLRWMTKEKNGTLFGVALWQDALKDDRVNEVIQKYKKQLNYWTVFFVLLQIPIYLVRYSSVTMILWMVWLFAMIAFIYTPYVKANKRMRIIKSEYLIEHNEGQQSYTYANVTAASCSVVEKQRKKLLEGRELLVSEDDNWIWGIFYYNKNDKRFLVDSRMGTGSAINMAHRAAVIFNGFIIALVLLTVVGTGAIMALEEFTPIKLAYDEEQLVAEHWKEEYRISKEDIASVTLLEELPRMSKSSGTGMENVYKGKWFSREYNKRFKVCLNPQELPVIMVETKDGTWYLLGDGESEQTEVIYQELIGEK